jgi:hypothetical protein
VHSVRAELFHCSFYISLEWWVPASGQAARWSKLRRKQPKSESCRETRRRHKNPVRIYNPRTRRLHATSHSRKLSQQNSPRTAPTSMLGRLLHYGADAVLLSTVLAGIKRSSGFQCVLLRLSRTKAANAERVVGLRRAPSVTIPLEGLQTSI